MVRYNPSGGRSCALSPHQVGVQAHQPSADVLGKCQHRFTRANEKNDNFQFWQRGAGVVSNPFTHGVRRCGPGGQCQDGMVQVPSENPGGFNVNPFLKVFEIIT